MATLEKIRSKSTLLLIVVGAALLAFIIGDFFTSGRTLFGTGTTIAKVGKEKIDIQEFQRRYEEVNQQYQQQNTKMDPAALQQYVLNQMIQERLINKEIEDLGIEVTDNELSKAMLGPNAHYAMIQFAQQMGFQSPDQLYDVAFNPTKYNVPADQAQQDECDPVIDAGDVALELAAQQPAQHRHHGLEEAEGDSDRRPPWSGTRRGSPPPEHPSGIFP